MFSSSLFIELCMLFWELFEVLCFHFCIPFVTQAQCHVNIATLLYPRAFVPGFPEMWKSETVILFYKMPQYVHVTCVILQHA